MERRQGERRRAGRRVADLHAVSERAPAARVPGKRRRLALLVVVFLLIVPFAWPALRRFDLFQGPTIPTELVGVWTTTEASYADRALEFTRYSVILHTDEDHFSVHYVRDVQRNARERYVQYRVEYQDADGPTILDFRYVAGKQPVIEMAHMTAVWKRTAVTTEQ